MTAAVRTIASRRQPGFAELGIVILLYAAYELLRGLGDASVTVARHHTADIVALERSFNVFIEQAVQDWAAGLPALPTLLGTFYVTSHFGLTAAALVWMHRSHPARFPLVRNTLVIGTALSLVGYVLYPAAPPRLSGHGFADTVSSHTHVNLSSDLLGSLYNPFAAVPSMHFGYALIVGVAVFSYARRPSSAPSAPSTRRSCSSTSSRRATTSSSTRRWAASSSPRRSSPPASSIGAQRRPPCRNPRNPPPSVPPRRAAGLPAACRLERAVTVTRPPREPAVTVPARNDACPRLKLGFARRRSVTVPTSSGARLGDCPRARARVSFCARAGCG